MNTDYPCSVCRKEVYNDAIECDICKLWTHRRCGKLKKRYLEFLSNPIYRYYCPMCRDIFPFSNVDDEELQWVLTKLDINEDIFYYYNKCNDINLNCLSYSEDRKCNWEEDKDPDMNFYNDVNLNCKYFTEDQFNVEFKTVNNLSIIHFNARSLKANFNLIRSYINTLNVRFDVIAISESWIESSTDVSEFHLNNYEIIHTDRQNKRGGGVLLYVSKTLNFKKLDKYSVQLDDVMESVTIEIDIANSKNIILSCVYRSPGSKLEQFIDYIEQFLKSVKSNKTIYLCGDFNVDLLKQTHVYTDLFLETLYSYGMLPIITKPTRITSTTATLIDNIFTNNCFQTHYGGLLCTDISDHLPIFSICNIKGIHRCTEKEYKYIRKYYAQNMSRFKQNLTSKNWEDVLSCQDVDVAYDLFLNMFKDSHECCFPKCRVLINKNERDKPWLTKSLINACKKKNKLYRDFVKNGCKKAEEKYKKYKNKLTSVIKFAEKQYYSDVLEKIIIILKQPGILLTA